MSAKVMGQVYDYVTSAREQAVLLALADHADHNGDNAFPSVALIAWKTGMSDRGVQLILARLRERSVLVEQRAAHAQRPRTYRIVLNALDPKPAFRPKRGVAHAPQTGEVAAPMTGEAAAGVTGAAAAPVAVDETGEAGDERGEVRAPRGERRGRRGVQQLLHPNRPEPSIETSEEPSALRAAGIEIPTRPPTPDEIRLEEKRFAKRAVAVWLEVAARIGSMYTDPIALGTVRHHAVVALDHGTEAQVLAAIRARMTRETTPRRIGELTRLHVGDEMQQRAIASKRAEMDDEIIDGPRVSGTLRPIGVAARTIVAAVAS